MFPFYKGLSPFLFYAISDFLPRFFLTMKSSSQSCICFPKPVDFSRFISSSTLVSVTWAYSWVVEMELCPIMRLTVSIGTPSERVMWVPNYAWPDGRSNQSHIPVPALVSML